MDKEDLTLPVHFQYYCPAQLWYYSVLWVPGWFPGWFDKDIICPLNKFMRVALHAENPGDFQLSYDNYGQWTIKDLDYLRIQGISAAAITTNDILSDFLDINNIAIYGDRRGWVFGWTNGLTGTAGHVSMI